MFERKNEYIQQLKNDMTNIQNIHQKEFDETMIETNNRIDELTKMNKNKNKIIDFLKKRLVDKFHKSMKSDDEKFSTESKIDDDVHHIDTKKNVKMIILFNSDEFIEKNEF